jgi:ABC-type multidrug transport system fused ATPase/permease subunit
MSGTIKDNLDPTFQYTDEEINNIIKDCNLAELVETKGGANAIINN